MVAVARGFSRRAGASRSSQRRRSYETAVALAAALALAAAPAGAQTAEQAALAREFERCNELIDRVRAAEAVECWRALRARSDAPAVQYNLAVALRALGRNRAAVAAFREFVGRAAGDASLGGYVRRATEAVRELTASMGRLELSTSPPDARVTLDGEEVAQGGGAIEVDPGDHTVVAEAPEHAPLTRRVRLTGGLTERLHVALTPLAQTGRLRVEAEPDHAAIAIDGERAGDGRVDEPVRAGGHRVVVTAPGYGPFERDVEVARGATVSLRAVLSDERPVTSRAWFRVTLGVGVAAAVAALVVGGVYLLSTTEEPFRGALYDIPPR